MVDITNVISVGTILDIIISTGSVLGLVYVAAKWLQRKVTSSVIELKTDITEVKEDVESKLEGERYRLQSQIQNNKSLAENINGKVTNTVNYVRELKDDIKDIEHKLDSRIEWEQDKITAYYVAEKDRDTQITELKRIIAELESRLEDVHAVVVANPYEDKIERFTSRSGIPVGAVSRPSGKPAVNIRSIVESEASAANAASISPSNGEADTKDLDMSSRERGRSRMLSPPPPTTTMMMDRDISSAEPAVVTPFSSTNNSSSNDNKNAINNTHHNQQHQRQKSVSTGSEQDN